MQKGKIYILGAQAWDSPPAISVYTIQTLAQVNIYKHVELYIHRVRIRPISLPCNKGVRETKLLAIYILTALDNTTSLPVQLE